MAADRGSARAITRPVISAHDAQAVPVPRSCCTARRPAPRPDNQCIPSDSRSETTAADSLEHRFIGTPPMPKNPDERIDSLERLLWRYKILSICLLVLVLVTQRVRIVGWIDKMENWVNGVSKVKS